MYDESTAASVKAHALTKASSAHPRSDAHRYSKKASALAHSNDVAGAAAMHIKAGAAHSAAAESSDQGADRDNHLKAKAAHYAAAAAHTKTLSMMAGGSENIHGGEPQGKGTGDQVPTTGEPGKPAGGSADTTGAEPKGEAAGAQRPKTQHAKEDYATKSTKEKNAAASGAMQMSALDNGPTGTVATNPNAPKEGKGAQVPKTAPTNKGGGQSKKQGDEPKQIDGKEVNKTSHKSDYDQHSSIAKSATKRASQASKAAYASSSGFSNASVDRAHAHHQRAAGEASVGAHTEAAYEHGQCAVHHKLAAQAHGYASEPGKSHLSAANAHTEAEGAHRQAVASKAGSQGGGSLPHGESTGAHVPTSEGALSQDILIRSIELSFENTCDKLARENPLVKAAANYKPFGVF